MHRRRCRSFAIQSIPKFNIYIFRDIFRSKHHTSISVISGLLRLRIDFSTVSAIEPCQLCTDYIYCDWFSVENYLAQCNSFFFFFPSLNCLTGRVHTKPGECNGEH